MKEMKVGGKNEGSRERWVLYTERGGGGGNNERSRER